MADNSVRFPQYQFSTCADYFNSYAQECARAAASVSRSQLDDAARLLLAAIDRDATIFCCGNGGSAALANHLQCDHQKGVHADTNYRTKIVCLSSNIALVTAVANDIGYADVFSYPLRLHGRPGDLLITISASGNSENIVRALQEAQSMKIESIAFTGFTGGRSRPLATANLHVDSENYGVVEDVHQSCMHALAQFIRQAAMPAALIKERWF